MPESAESPLPTEVVEQLLRELGRRGQKALDCLETARGLIGQARDPFPLPRLRESAAYNLREAFDAIVDGIDPGDGRVTRILDAWDRLEFEEGARGEEVAALRQDLFSELRGLSEERKRTESQATRRLRVHLQRRTGLEGDDHDPELVEAYTQTRSSAAKTLHTSISLDDLLCLYDATLGWFERMYTPATARAERLAALAAEPFTTTAQIERLREIGASAHDLRLFFERLTDPGWLPDLVTAHLIDVPAAGRTWAPAAMTAGLGATHPAEVVATLTEVYSRIKQRPPKQRPAAAFEILRVVVRLDTAGIELADKIVRQYGEDRNIRMLASGLLDRVAPSSPLVVSVVRAEVTAVSRYDAGSHVRDLLGQLESGMTVDNAEGRLRMLIGALQHRSKNPEARIVSPASFLTDLADERDPIVVVAHFFLRLAERAIELGISAESIFEWTDKVTGPVGVRLREQVACWTPNIDLTAKIDLVASRLDDLPTGEDASLVAHIVELGGEARASDAWRTNLGEPSERGDGDRPPKDWRRAWQWAGLLPAAALDRWQNQVAQIEAQYGPRSTEPWNKRLPLVFSTESPITAEELGALSVDEAIARISAWPSEPLADLLRSQASDLGHAVATTARNHLDAWTADPARVVTGLREPVYVFPYLRVLIENVNKIKDRGAAVVSAVETVLEQRWAPKDLDDRFGTERQSWEGIEAVAVDVAAAFATADAELDPMFETVWGWATDVANTAPEDSIDSSNDDDPLTTAINRPWGKGLEAQLALALWHLRHRDTLPAGLPSQLTRCLDPDDSRAMHYRSILARWRPILEDHLADWYETHRDALFRDERLGQATFELTLHWARPTQDFVATFQDELVSTAHAGNRDAITWALIACLNEEDGYDVPLVLDMASGSEDTTAAVATETARLVGPADIEAPLLDIGFQIWTALLDADRDAVPLSALSSLGAWARIDATRDPRWTDLMARTLNITGGAIDEPSDIARTLRDLQPSNHHLAMLLSLLTTGDLWEQMYTQDLAVESLRLSPRPASSEFHQLRDRLLELGRHDVMGIDPDEPE